MILIAWNDTKAANDDFLSSDWNAMVTVIEAKSTVSTGAGAPTSTPSNTGDLYVDTTNLKLYFASATSSSSDWKKVLTT